MPINTTPHARARLIRLSHALSYVLHPAVLLLATMLSISSMRRGSLSLALQDAVVLLLGLLPGLLYMVVKTRQGRFGHYHLLLKEERRVVLPLLLLGLAGSLGLYQLLGAPDYISQGLLVGLLAGAGATIISRFWKISLHAAVAMGCAALFLPLSGTLMAIAMTLAVITGLARLPIGHHTAAQVVAGWVYGFGVTFALLLLL